MFWREGDTIRMDVEKTLTYLHEFRHGIKQKGR